VSDRELVNGVAKAARTCVKSVQVRINYTIDN